MKKIGFLILLLSGIASQTFATTRDLPDLIEVGTGATAKGVSISGADAQAIFNFIKAQSPAMYSKTVSSTFTYEHIRGNEIFCAKDTYKKSSKQTVVSYRCDLVVTGVGNLAPQLVHTGGDNPCADGSCGP